MHNPDHKNAKWKREDCKLFTKLWNEGATVEFIMQAFGVTRNAVLGIRYRLGLPIRRQATKGKKYEILKQAGRYRWR